MTKRRNATLRAEKPLDMVSQKRGRGRPGVRKSEIAGRAYHYRLLFGQIWEQVSPKLLQAKTEEEVTQALGQNDYYKQNLLCVASLIPKVTSDLRFPKSPQAQINFLADSLAGLGSISPRRSRDICDQERSKRRKKTRYKIIRHEYYIECSCGYKGPALNAACRKCGAEIPLSFGSIIGLGVR